MVGGVGVVGNSFGTDSHNDFDATCGHFNSLDDHLEMHLSMLEIIVIATTGVPLVYRIKLVIDVLRVEKDLND